MKWSNLHKTVFYTFTASIVAVSVMQSANAAPYWKDSSGQMVRTGYGECWRTSERTDENALPECEGRMAKADSRPKAMSDKDGDGVQDKNDQCPQTAKGAKVDSRGCAVNNDKDGDGVQDNNDQCPKTEKGTRVDSRGCVVNNDKDGDGVVDAKDDCPNTAKGAITNKDGCKLKESIDLSNIEFATGTAKLSSASQSDLDAAAKVLVANSHLNFEVAGHTDSAGNHSRNVSLSQKRADAVRSYLVAKGVAGDRLTAKGYGPATPVASNDTADGRARNRRVELVLK